MLSSVASVAVNGPSQDLANSLECGLASGHSVLDDAALHSFQPNSPSADAVTLLQTQWWLI